MSVWVKNVLVLNNIAFNIFDQSQCADNIIAPALIMEMDYSLTIKNSVDSPTAYGDWPAYPANQVAAIWSAQNRKGAD